MVNFPKLIGHNYLGPGNPTLNGNPVNRADSLAKEHDLWYDILIKEGAKVSKKTFNDAIQLIDKEYIDKFIASAQEGDDDFSYVGAVGLGLKWTSEKVANWLTETIFYPSRKTVKAYDAKTNPEPYVYLSAEDFIAKLKSTFPAGNGST